uniref:Mediator of RNA polymerase II transcription subunit 6 n=1 Tax=Spongospora subterranea TaxID=70186 RepID=A0A0H5QR80_9EUKA|eukprot:CRZ04548.1 hypothetical protein [Spongospora subterranea]
MATAALGQTDTSHTYQSWRFLAWLQAWPLNRSTLFDYFKQSTFYDSSCNNELLILQRTVDHSHLKTMVGLEYEVDSSSRASESPSYFLIKKQDRHSETSTTCLAVYYIIGTGPQWGTIYQMPSVYSVLVCNLGTSSYYVGQALEALASHIDYSPLTGYSWASENSDKNPEAPAPVAYRYSNPVDAVITKQYEK